MLSPDVPKSEPAPPPPSDTAAEEAAAEARKTAKRKKGRASTILTSPAGAALGDAGNTTATQKTLGTK
jgi:hypothetical protein